MRKLKATKDEIKKAADMAADMGVLNNSLTKGDGSQAGFLAEIVVARHIGATQANTYDYDLIMPDGRTIDVKVKEPAWSLKSITNVLSLLTTPLKPAITTPFVAS